MDEMCGRVIQASPPDQLGLKIIDALDPRDNRVSGDPFGNVPPRYNGAPSQQLWVIRQNAQTGERSLDLLQWVALDRLRDLTWPSLPRIGSIQRPKVPCSRSPMCSASGALRRADFLGTLRISDRTAQDEMMGCTSVHQLGLRQPAVQIGCPRLYLRSYDNRVMPPFFRRSPVLGTRRQCC